MFPPLRQRDGGAVTYTLSGWLGGYGSQGDNATLTATFQDAAGTALGSATIGPITAADRNDEAGLFERSTTGSVPTGTRGVQVILLMTRTSGDANDGYGDDLSLVFSGT